MSSERATRVATTGKRTGVLSTASAFVLWGFFPLYLRPLHTVETVEIIASRIAWSCVFVLIWLGWRRELSVLRETLGNRRVMARLCLTAALVTCNWLIYVWAVGHGRVVESSLGYFINPLVNVLLGTALLGERFNRVQWLAIAIAALGVVHLTVASGSLPWIPLGLALSFGLYGLVRKVVQIESLPALGVETLLLMPLALGYLFWAHSRGTLSFGHSGRLIDVMLIGSGPFTATALFLFAHGARRIPYATVGVLQYITPTLQLLCGLLVFRESFQSYRILGFSIIWVGLLVYATDGLWRARMLRQRLAA
ncbi:MAG TPA: EamA family transporter RarD [Steroidobacteraceae bacterium]|nr:EamA family transporter RarD [Steroidobacteraceae bacterium]